MNIFERASRAKTRFTTSRGELSTEQLWDLSLEALDTLAIAVNKQIKEKSEESFIAKKTVANTELELKLEILKHIITSKISDKEAAATRKAKQEQIKELEGLLVEKRGEELKSKSPAEIQAMLEKLKGE
jgi:uncharacterized Fe-S cluster-containing radical SAM superfamily protein